MVALRADTDSHVRFATADRGRARRLGLRLVFLIALPFGWMQRDLAGIYRRCLGARPLWLPLTAVLIPFVLLLWALNRVTFTILYRGMTRIAGVDA